MKKRKHAREGWAEAFARMHAAGDDRLLDPGCEDWEDGLASGGFRSGCADTSERVKEILADAAGHGKWRRQPSRGGPEKGDSSG
jgi:hypothetical protein